MRSRTNSEFQQRQERRSEWVSVGRNGAKTDGEAVVE
jgi:hypothetical protein